MVVLVGVEFARNSCVDLLRCSHGWAKSFRWRLQIRVKNATLRDGVGTCFSMITFRLAHHERPLCAKSRRSPLLLSVAYQMLGVDDGKANVVLTERVEERLLALHLRKIVEIAVPPEEFERRWSKKPAADDIHGPVSSATVI